jgi:hypothetical protein
VAFERSSSPGGQPQILSAAMTQPATPERSNGMHHIGRLAVTPAVQAWPAGGAPLVRWLRANPDVLGELIGLRLEATDDEVPGLEAAIFASEDGTRLRAVLELGTSSEATLGSLLTRLGTAHASVAIWICGEARDEHLAAVSWLNRSVEGRFYIARVQAARIGASEPAPILSLALRPPRSSDASRRTDATGTDTERARRAGDAPEVRLGDEG